MIGCVLCVVTLLIIFYFYFRIPLPAKLTNNVVISNVEFVNRLLLKIPANFLQKYVGENAKVWYTRKYFSIVGERPIDPNKEQDLIITTENYNGVKVRVYRPKYKPNDSGIIYIHGGGFVILAINFYDNLMARFVRQSQRTVVSIEYRLAPEHPFPAGVEDCDAAASYFLENCQEKYGINPEKVVIMGDSAGGNLSAVIANRFRDKYKLQGQILIYPWTQFVDFQTPSFQQYHNQYPGATFPILNPDYLAAWFLQYSGIKVTVDGMRDVMENNHVTKEAREKEFFKFVDHKLLEKKYKTPDIYAGPKFKNGNKELYEKLETVLYDPDFSPLMKPDLSGAPPALVVTVGFDVIRDDGLWYVGKLRKDGVTVEHLHYDDSYHGIMNAPEEAQMIVFKIVHFMNKL